VRNERKSQNKPELDHKDRNTLVDVRNVGAIVSVVNVVNLVARLVAL
jgi:hypothetical protein